MLYWKEIKDRNRTPDQLAVLDVQIRQELDAMVLRERQEASNKTQEEVVEGG